MTATASCIYCGSPDNSDRFPTASMYGHSYMVRQCHRCETYFLHPPPSPDQLAEAYDESYYGDQDEKFTGMVEQILEIFRRKRAALVASHLPNGGKVLDVGCGNGRFLDCLEKKGAYTLFGVEMPGKAAERAARIPAIHLKKGVLEAGDFDRESLDAVTLFHVLEHLPSPRETLSVISEILKPGGLAVFSFPNIASRQAQWFKGQWLHLDPPRHLWLMPPRRFILEMEKLGFSLLSQQHFSIEYNPFGYQQSLLNVCLEKREILFEYLKGNAAYVSGYSKGALRIQKMAYQLTFPLFVLWDALDAMLGKGATVQLAFGKAR